MKSPHPVVWTILYFPFGALGGFVSVALTFLATRHGLSITEGALLGGAQMLSQWLKWSWAPLVDVTLTPRTWYGIATVCSAIGMVLMAAVPLSPETLGLLLAIVAVSSLINSIVGMAIEAMMAVVTPPDEVGRNSAWFQAGNLGGYGLGGGIGLYLLGALPQPWMAGAILGASFLACNAALMWLPRFPIHRHEGGVSAAMSGLASDLVQLGRTKGALLAAVLCFLPIGTGAASGVLTQAAVAGHWGAGDEEVAWVQGIFAGVVTAIGCFGGGWLCDRVAPRRAYAGIGLMLAGIAVVMALLPGTVTMYVVMSLTYSLGVGFAYAAFTAVVLSSIGARSAATKYNLYASLSNFPIWWLGLLLGAVADRYGAPQMLMAEAALGVIGVGFFAMVTQVVQRTSLPETVVEAVTPTPAG